MNRRQRRTEGGEEKRKVQKTVYKTEHEKNASRRMSNLYTHIIPQESTNI